MLWISLEPNTVRSLLLLDNLLWLRSTKRLKRFSKICDSGIYRTNELHYMSSLLLRSCCCCCCLVVPVCKCKSLLQAGMVQMPVLMMPKCHMPNAKRQKLNANAKCQTQMPNAQSQMSNAQCTMFPLPNGKAQHECQMPNSKYKCPMLNTKCQVLKAKCQMPNAKCTNAKCQIQMPSAKCQMPNANAKCTNAKCTNAQMHKC